jgi:hypothetical protein
MYPDRYEHDMIYSDKSLDVYASTMWEHIALHLSVRQSVRPEILWTQLLLHRMADFA